MLPLFLLERLGFSFSAASSMGVHTDHARQLWFKQHLRSGSQLLICSESKRRWAMTFPTAAPTIGNDDRAKSTARVV